MRAGPGIELRKKRHDAIPQDVAVAVRLVVRRVLAIGFAAGRKLRENVLLRKGQQGPYQVDRLVGKWRAVRRDARKPPQAAAAHEVHENGLRVIVRVMRHRHPGCAAEFLRNLCGNLRKDPIALGAPGLFNTLPALFCKRRNIHADCAKCNPEPLRSLAAERLVAVCFRAADSVVDVDCRKV